MAQQLADFSNQLQHPTATHNSGYVVGVDIGGTNLRLALADIAGTVVARWNVPTAGASDPDAIVARISEGIQHLCDRAGIPRQAVRSLAAGAPGITDVDRGVVIATSYLMGWRNIPLRAMLEAALKIPVSIDNDVNLAAIGEGHTGAAQGTRDFVFLAIGTGIGAGIVLNGRSYRGHGWTAGEIGYMLVPGVSEGPVERGKPGSLEETAGGAGIEAHWQTTLGHGATLPIARLTATQIFDRALEHDPIAQKILDNTARTVAYAVYNISLILNCPLFVLGGGIGIHPALCDAVRVVLEERSVRVQPRLVLSALRTEAQIAGAICLAIETANLKPETVTP
jgi:glucokinase